MRFLLLIAFVWISQSLMANDSSTFKGVWKASQKGDFYYFLFENDSLMKIAHGNDTTSIRFYTDTAQTPMHFTMHILDPNSGEELYVNHGIFEWMNPTRFRLRMSDNMRDRPLSFLPKGNLDTYILVKQ